MLVVQWWESYEQTLWALCAQKKYTVLYFYPKDKTPWCTIESEDFQSKYAAFEALDAQIVGVSKDGVKNT